MSKDNSKEALLKVLHTIKEQTGVDLTDKADKVVLVNADKVKTQEEFDALMEAKGTVSQEDAEELLKIMAEGASSFDTQEVSILKRKEDLDGFSFEIVSGIDSGARVVALSKKSCLSFDLYDDVISFTSSTEKIQGFHIALSLNEKTSREDIISMISVLAKHVDILASLYEYEVPSTDVCMEFAEQVLYVKQAFEEVLAETRAELSE